MELRNRLTGEVITVQEWKQRNPGIAMPVIWTEETFNALGHDPVHSIAPSGPPSSSVKQWVHKGVKQLETGEWVYNWEEEFIYADVPGGPTKAELEAQHLAREEQSFADGARVARNDRLKLSDWVILKALEDGTSVPQVWVNYRQALRDVPSQPGFPRNFTWPEIPQ